MKNILVINSSVNKLTPLLNIFEALRERDYSFYLFSSKKLFKKNFQEKQWPASIVFLAFRIDRISCLIIDIILYPIFSLYWLALLLIAKFKNKINNIILINWKEKIFITPLAKVLKLKCIWLELPENDYKTKSKLFKNIYKLISHLAIVAVFIEHTRKQLENIGIDKSKIKFIPIGINLNQYKFQENIFDELAQSDSKNYHRKYFTCGTVLNLNQPSQIENLFRSVKDCLAVIPNLQIVVVGDGEERKNLIWLAKRLEIETLVWFVGEQKHLKKWLDGFDIYIATCEDAKLADIETTLKAMAARLPIVGFLYAGVGDVVTEGVNGILVEKNKNELLTDSIINLYKDSLYRKKLSKNSQELIIRHNQMDNSINKFDKILNEKN